MLLSLALAPVGVLALGACIVWPYNRIAPYWRESPLKKALALGMPMIALLVGGGGSVVFAWNDARLALILLLAQAPIAALALRSIVVQAVADHDDTRRRRAERVSLPPEAGIDWPRIGGITRVLLRAVSPINEATALEVHRYTVEIDGLPEELRGYRIAHLTDFHRHKHLNAAYFRAAVEATNALAPDVILLGGDYITKRPFIGEIADMLANLRAPDGVLAIRGNHDYWTRPGAVASQLARAGARLLVNEAVRIERGSAALRVVGIEDPYIPLGPREQRRLLAEAAQAAVTIALVHTPEVFSLAASLGADVAFAGHTHGGQVRLPLIGTTLAGCPCGPGFAHGSNRIGAMRTFTANGLGAFFPFRFRCRPALLLVEIVHP